MKTKYKITMLAIQIPTLAIFGCFYGYYTIHHPEEETQAAIIIFTVALVILSPVSYLIAKRAKKDSMHAK